MKKRNLFVILGVLVVIVVLAVFVVPNPLRQRLLGGQGANALAAYQTQQAVRGDLTAFVGATGAVRSNQTAIIAWQTSGKVAELKAQTGQQVKANEVLATLDPTSLSQTIIMAQSDLINAKNALENVMDNSKARADAELALVQAQKALNDAEKNTTSKLYQNAGENTIDTARANLILAQKEVDNAETTYSHVSQRSNDDPVYAAALSAMASARQKRDAAQNNLNYVLNLPDPRDVQEVYAKLDQAKAALLTAKTNWEKIKDGANPDDISAAQAKVDAVQATLNTTRLTAPFDGTITDVSIQVGDMVAPSTAAFRIDDLSRLLIDLQVSEVDVNRVQLNQPVELTFDAIPNETFTGAVVEVASFGTAAASGGTVNFTVTVEISSEHKEIRPGMTASANVAVSQLHDVLLVPYRAVRVVNGKRVVYVERNNSLATVEISLGSSDNANVVVTSGDIQPGDLIVLNPPSNPFAGGAFGPRGGGGNGGGGNAGGSSSGGSTTGGSDTGGNGSSGGKP